MKHSDYLIETDILVEHLTHKNDGKESILETFMQKGVCYTSVINASEILFALNSEKEIDSAIKLLSSIKVLGLNSRYSLNLAGLKSKLYNSRDALFFILAKLNKLKIITRDNTKYSKISNQVQVINP